MTRPPLYEFRARGTEPAVARDVGLPARQLRLAPFARFPGEGLSPGGPGELSRFPQDEERPFACFAETRALWRSVWKAREGW